MAQLYEHWAIREADFWLPWGNRNWWGRQKRNMPEGTELIRVYEMRNGDGRAWVSLDGNWDYDPLPIHPPATYEEVVYRLARCALAPPLHIVYTDDGPHLTFDIWPVPPSTPWRWDEVQNDTDTDGTEQP